MIEWLGGKGGVFLGRAKKKVYPGPVTIRGSSQRKKSAVRERVGKVAKRKNGGHAAAVGRGTPARETKEVKPNRPAGFTPQGTISGGGSQERALIVGSRHCSGERNESQRLLRLCVHAHKRGEMCFPHTQQEGGSRGTINPEKINFNRDGFSNGKGETGLNPLQPKVVSKDGDRSKKVRID